MKMPPRPSPRVSPRGGQRGRGARYTDTGWTAGVILASGTLRVIDGGFTVPVTNSGLGLLPTADLLDRRERYLAMVQTPAIAAYVREIDAELARRAARMLGR